MALTQLRDNPEEREKCRISLRKSPSTVLPPYGEDLDELRQQTGATLASTTGSKVLQLCDLRSFLASEPHGSCRCTTTGM